MEDVFTLLADPGRRQILSALLQGERAAGDLAALLPISQPAVSKHLRLLREAGMVRVTADAQRRLYSLAPDALAEVEAYLSPFRAFWERRLSALATHLDQET